MAERGATRDARRRALVELVQREEISSQLQLQERLTEIGFTANQATLSRDLRELGVVKVPLGPTGSRYVVPGQEPRARPHHEETFRKQVLSVRRSHNILVLKTGPGHAQAACLAMDNMALPGILGTVAGDDTFLAVLEPDSDWAATEEGVQGLLRG